MKIANEQQVTKKSLRRKVVMAVMVFAFLWVTAMIVLAPIFLKTWRNEKRASEVFSKFTQALIRKDYATAYQYCGSDFRNAQSLQEFESQESEITSRLGDLKNVHITYFVVKRPGEPEALWTATIEANLIYKSATLDVVYVLREENQSWKLFGFKQL